MQNSIQLDLSAQLAVVCHDAGASNTIFAWLRQAAAENPAIACNWRLMAKGPAAKLWNERGAPLARLCSTFDEAFDGASVLVSGTGWASDLEHEARRFAQARGIKSLAVIDHWVNYRERFVRNEQLVLPDEILVTDEFAMAEAQRCFPELSISLQPNLYLQECVQTIATHVEQDGDFLYVLEPIRDDWGRGQPGEFQALDFFVENLSRIVPAQNCTIRLRPHPSDLPGKYDKWIAAHPDIRATIDQSTSLAEAIGPAHWVVGAETFAMVIALSAGRSVISTLPPWAHRCRLPHSSIVHLRDIAPQ